MNYIKKDFMYFVCLIVCCITQRGYAGQNYHGIIRRDNSNVSAGITWRQQFHNKWDALKRDQQEHYNRIGMAHLQAGQLRNTNTNNSKKQ